MYSGSPAAQPDPGLSSTWRLQWGASREGPRVSESGVSATGFPITLEENTMQRPGCLVLNKGLGPPAHPGW